MTMFPLVAIAINEDGLIAHGSFGHWWNDAKTQSWNKGCRHVVRAKSSSAARWWCGNASAFLWSDRRHRIDQSRCRPNLLTPPTPFGGCMPMFDPIYAAMLSVYWALLWFVDRRHSFSASLAAILASIWAFAAIWH